MNSSQRLGIATMVSVVTLVFSVGASIAIVFVLMIVAGEGLGGRRPSTALVAAFFAILFVAPAAGVWLTTIVTRNFVRYTSRQTLRAEPVVAGSALAVMVLVGLATNEGFRQGLERIALAGLVLPFAGAFAGTYIDWPEELRPWHLAILAGIAALSILWLNGQP